MSKSKVPYEILAIQVDKLYPPASVLKPGETLEERISFIESLITSCGWTVDDFLQEYIHRGVVEFLPPGIKESN